MTPAPLDRESVQTGGVLAVVWEVLTEWGPELLVELGGVWGILIAAGGALVTALVFGLRPRDSGESVQEPPA